MSMDYTKIPKELIYQDKEDLEDFISANKLTATVVENMENIDILTNDEFESSALLCMNTAYYICTLIMLEKRPEWRWGFFLDYAGNVSGNQQGEFMDTIIVLVYILLDHSNGNWKQQHIKIMNKLTEYVRPLIFAGRMSAARNAVLGTPSQDAIWNILSNGVTAAMTISVDEFAPCKIDNETISKVSQFSWADYTNKFEEKKVIEFLDSLGRDSSEKLRLTELLTQKATDYYGEGNDFFPIFECLSEYKESLDKESFDSLFEDSPEASDKATIKTDDTNKSMDSENPKLIENQIQDDIEALKKENALLKEQLDQQTSDDQNELIETLRNDLEAFKSQDGKNRMTAGQAALFIQAVCHNIGGLPNDKKQLSPILEYGWGFSESTAKRALGARPTLENVESVVQLFESHSPKLARKIKEFPEEFDELRRKKLNDNNDKKLKTLNR